MRVRKYHQNSGKSSVCKPIDVGNPETAIKEPANLKPIVQLDTKVPKQKNQGAAALFRKIMTNPNLNVQLLVIVLTLASDTVPMARSIDSMSSTVDKIRNITDVINNTMQSVKVAAEAPNQIRRLFDT